MRRLTFILGGARSGKSDHAQRLAQQERGPVLYIATAEAQDDEMRSRIDAHRQRRPTAWETMEIPSQVGRLLLAEPPRADVILLDCLTLLVSNCLLRASPDAAQPDEASARSAVEDETRVLLQAVEQIPAHWVVVSNEVGQGIVPAYPTGRLFRDLLGYANQQMAAHADEVIWMVAGIPVPIGQHRAINRTA